MFKGSFVALITPFKNGKVDEDRLRELVEWQISEGTNGIVPVGTTGESPTLSLEEHLRVIEIVAQTTKKRVPVIAGTGSNSTEEAIELSREATKFWVDALLLVNPYYNKPTQEGLLAHFSAIARAVDIPIILYNIPSRSGVNLEPKTIAILAKKNENIVGVKEATGRMEQTTEIIQQTGPHFSILSGDDALTLPLMSIGAHGVISVVANLVPGDVNRMCQLALNQNFKEAKKIHQKLYPLVKSMFLETNPAPIKAAMKQVGLIEEETLRLPLVKIQQQTKEKVDQAIKDYGVKILRGIKG